MVRSFLLITALAMTGANANAGDHNPDIFGGASKVTIVDASIDEVTTALEADDLLFIADHIVADGPTVTGDVLVDRHLASLKDPDIRPIDFRVVILDQNVLRIYETDDGTAVMIQ